MADDTVRVAVRIRPLVSSELERGCRNSIDVHAQDNQLQVTGTEKAFTFNHVFGTTVDHEEFYEKAVKDMIPNIFKGYNVTILAYGQTGSGKTHTMGTNYSGEEAMGVIPRAIHDIFTTITKKEDWNFRVTVSFMELYKEQLYDLLAGDKDRKDCIVDIREERKEIKIVGITEKLVHNADDTLKLLVEGSMGRATGATAMNNQSSRSHAIFTISIQQQKNDDTNSATSAKFHLVDLAGSERSKKTGATGERFKEGVNINRGLLALGNVISQLGDGGGSTFITYRDSKLTRLLQDSLGGNSVTLMIACVSPADYNLDETLSTLRYADRARKIKNKPIVNQDPKTAEINRLQAAVRELKLALLVQGPMFTCPPEHANLEEKNRLLQKKLHQLMEKFNTSLINTMCMNERGELAESAKEQLCVNLTAILEEFSAFLQNEDLTDSNRMILHDIYQKLNELMDHQKKIDAEIISHISCAQISSAQISCDDAADEGGDSCQNVIETMELDEEHAEHTLRQAERENEVQTINRALALKEELVLKLLGNGFELSDQTKEIHDMENEIKNLQAEKEQLLKTLENVQTNKVSSKLAESRRKKVQELEKKILELSKKCIEQNRVIKAKEKSDIQVKNLTGEIQSLKQTRVKLIREMRKEAEKFSQYKLMRERELHKLKDQDRKRQNQIVRMQIQHNKQQNVSKRKMEEASAIIKRLKEGREKQRQAELRREKSKVSKEEIKNWISEEITILLNTTEAKCSLDKLMKDRARLTVELEHLKQSCKNNPSAELQNQIADSTEYLELRNVQISELQQKIIETEEENRVNSRWKAIQSLGDTKVAIDMLIESTSECAEKYHMKCYEYDELMDKYDEALMNSRKYELKELSRQCNSNLRIPEINSANVDEDTVNEIEKLKRELEVANEQLAAFQKRKKPKNPQLTQVNEVHALDFTDDSIIIEDDDIENDPDWRKTPMHKRCRVSIFKSIGDTSNEQVATKRSSDGEVKCACRTKCTSRICSCRKNTESCGKSCGCNPDICENKEKTNISKPYFNEMSECNIEINSSKRSRNDTT